MWWCETYPLGRMFSLWLVVCVGGLWDCGGVVVVGVVLDVVEVVVGIGFVAVACARSLRLGMQCIAGTVGTSYSCLIFASALV